MRGLPTDYRPFFFALTGFSPYPYQVRLANEEWPDVVDVPTGLGKTAAIVVAWLWKRLRDEAGTPRRLVYCLPMRTLVDQTVSVARGMVERAAALVKASDWKTPTVHGMLGGDVDEEWERHPENAAIIVGTQDMLLSRALNRGYAMSRYKWPMHFGLLNNDTLWVFDEVQLLGVAKTTAAQLQGLREKLGCLAPSRTLWMSATLTLDEFDTVDYSLGSSVCRLTAADLDHPAARERVEARKRLERVENVQLEKDAKGDLGAYCRKLASAVMEAHRTGTLTIVVVNRVNRAQQIFAELERLTASSGPAIALIHSRFRPFDRKAKLDTLRQEGDRIVVATQAIEAGVDVSATTLVTELAPWSSLVQRFGRCNRYGEIDDARVLWVDIDEEGSRGATALPYQPSQLVDARTRLELLDVADIQRIQDVVAPVDISVVPVLRRKDLLELFDTTPDLAGNDLDVSRYIRDSADSDIHVYWREYAERPSPEQASAEREELCRVSIASFGDFLKSLRSARDKAQTGKNKLLAKYYRALRWDPLENLWSEPRGIIPGSTVLLHPVVGGYTSQLGWNGEVAKLPAQVEPWLPSCAGGAADTALAELAMGDDKSLNAGAWVSLTAHLDDVSRAVAEIGRELQLPADLCSRLVRAAEWHDLGKAHHVFQSMLLSSATDGELPGENELWAKSARQRGGRAERRYFRHELVSALGYLQHRPGDAEADLVSYLIASHHGKIRSSIRSLPGEKEPDDPRRIFARGVWDGDEIPAVRFSDGRVVAAWSVDLALARMGPGSWVSRVVGLRDRADLGPFRLAYLEAVLRVADWRGSAVHDELDYEQLAARGVG